MHVFVSIWVGVSLLNILILNSRPIFFFISLYVVLSSVQCLHCSFVLTFVPVWCSVSCVV